MSGNTEAWPDDLVLEARTQDGFGVEGNGRGTVKMRRLSLGWRVWGF